MESLLSNQLFLLHIIKHVNGWMVFNLTTNHFFSSRHNGCLISKPKK